MVQRREGPLWRERRKEGRHRAGNSRSGGGSSGAAEVTARAGGSRRHSVPELVFRLNSREQKLAAKTFVAGGGLGRRLGTRELVGGEPRFHQAWRARSLPAATASSLSSLRQKVDRKRRISTLASIWSRKMALYMRYDFLMKIFLITNEI